LVVTISSRETGFIGELHSDTPSQLGDGLSRIDSDRLPPCLVVLDELSVNPLAGTDFDDLFS
jgi:hypothetical protein